MEDRILQGPPKSVPRFASFRTKAQAPLCESGSEPEQKNRLLAGIEKVSEHIQNHKSEHHRRHARSNLHSSQARRQSQSHAVERREASEVERVPWEESPSCFVIDQIGDTQNLTYGALHQREVPTYFRLGAGGVIGSSSDAKIDRSISNGNSIVLSSRFAGLQGRRDKEAFSKTNRVGLRKLRVRQDGLQDPQADAAADFLPLRPTNRQTRKGEADGNTSDSSVSSGGAARHHRSKNGKHELVDRPIDRDLQYSSDTSMSGYEGGRSSDLHDAVQQRRIALSRRLNVDPANGDAWQELIDLQDKVLGIPESRSTSAERQSKAHIKISIYEIAIEKVADDKTREALLLGMMEEGSEVWGGNKMSSKWRILLQTYPEYQGLWIKYLDHKQTTFSSFTFEDSRNVYVDCLRMLQCARTSVVDDEKISESQVYVLLRMTLFLREAGFLERAIATWQAVLEWEMHRPTVLKLLAFGSDDTKNLNALSSFADFWEAEVPRIGEEGAKGWATFKQGEFESSKPRKDDIEIVEDGLTLFRSWAETERGRSLQSRTVARAGDDIDDNDPYRIVMFSDIEDLLLISRESPQRWKFISDALLIFCNLPPCLMEHAGSRTRRWWKDPFLRNLHRSSVHLSRWQLRWPANKSKIPLVSSSHEGPPPDTSRWSSPFGFPTFDYQVSSDSLFAPKGLWFSALDAWEHAGSPDDGPVQAAWAHRLLKALVDADIGGEYLEEYYLALELRLSPGNVKRTAKSLIKKRPSSIRLYNAFVSINCWLGQFTNGEKAMITAINMSRDLPESSQRDSILLWHTWLWALLDSGRILPALERLLTFADPVLDAKLHEEERDVSAILPAIEPPMLLRTRTALNAARDHFLSLALPNNAVLAVDCLILLSYFSNSHSTAAALSSFKFNLVILNAHSGPNSLHIEQMHQSFARLLYFHATHATLFTPSSIRSPLAESIALFPSNTIFLSLFAWLESRFRIDDRVRSIMKDVVLTNNHDPRRKDKESVISYFFAIYAELNRGITLGSNTHAIRGTFERAVESNCGVHCVGLWKLYFSFEHSGGEMQRAKMVFYRGIRACPWAKELYMLAFEYLEPVMGEPELRGVYETLGEKELRVHVEFGGFQEMIEANGDNAGGDQQA